jgi:hypothetical protein
VGRQQQAGAPFDHVQLEEAAAPIQNEVKMVTSRAASFFNARPADPLIPLPMGPRPRLAGSGKKNTARSTWRTECSFPLFWTCAARHWCGGVQRAACSVLGIKFIGPPKLPMWLWYTFSLVCTPMWLRNCSSNFRVPMNLQQWTTVMV